MRKNGKNQISGRTGFSRIHEERNQREKEECCPLQGGQAANAKKWVDEKQESKTLDSSHNATGPKSGGKFIIKEKKKKMGGRCRNEDGNDGHRVRNLESAGPVTEQINLVQDGGG